MRLCNMIASLGVVFLMPLVWAGEQPPASLWTLSDYDDGDWYVVRGDERLSFHGMREAWVYNRAMVWLDRMAGLEGAILCYSAKSPLPLTGKSQVSRWFSDPENLLEDVDEHFTRFVKRSRQLTWDHACLPPFQFSIEQHPVAELTVRQAIGRWQFIALVKGRSGPPLYASPWYEGPGTLRVDLRELYRAKGYRHHFAELVFFLALWDNSPQGEPSAEFCLNLVGPAAVVPALPIVRSADRTAQEGVPVYAVVLNEQAQPLGPEHIRLTARWGTQTVPLRPRKNRLWEGRLWGLPIGDHRIVLEASWTDGTGRKATGELRVRVTDGKFVRYDKALRLLRKGDELLGPVTGSYRGQIVFRQLGTAQERPLQGEADWREAIAHPGRPDYGFHFWEALTPAELEEDYAYLARCGWQMVHLCSGWLWWPRWDAAGHLSPFYAEQLCEVSAAATRHNLILLLALSHYPLGQASAPYAQYLEAGYRREDYENPDASFYPMFGNYLREFAEVFRDDSTIGMFTASGEGDHACGKTFVNFVHDRMAELSPQHLFACEPHWKIVQYPNFYRQEGWRPLLGGMRTYFVDNGPPEAVGVQFKLAGMGHVFMAEGCFYGFLGGNHQYMNPEMPVASYRWRVRETIYTGLAHRNPVLLTWEERIVEDERIIFREICRQIDWSTRFAQPPVAIRVWPEHMPPEGRDVLFRLERKLTQIPLESFYLWQEEAPPPAAAVVIDARKPPESLQFASQGGSLPDHLARATPLRLATGWRANYSWSEDRSILLAFIRRADPENIWSTEEGGPYSYVDTSIAICEPMTLTAWEVLCRKPGRIALRIYRPTGDRLLLVAETPLELMDRPGWCRFMLSEPIVVEKGDLVGFYLPEEKARIAARAGGRMLYVVGPGMGESRLDDWESEPKSAAIRLISAECQQAKVVGKGDAFELVNFPDLPLRYAVYDLAKKKCIREATFRTGCRVELPADSQEVFLVVTKP